MGGSCGIGDGRWRRRRPAKGGRAASRAPWNTAADPVRGGPRSRARCHLRGPGGITLSAPATGTVRSRRPPRLPLRRRRHLLSLRAAPAPRPHWTSSVSTPAPLPWPSSGGRSNRQPYGPASPGAAPCAGCAGGQPPAGLRVAFLERSGAACSRIAGTPAGQDSAPFRPAAAGRARRRVALVERRGRRRASGEWAARFRARPGPSGSPGSGDGSPARRPRHDQVDTARRSGTPHLVRVTISGRPHAALPAAPASTGSGGRSLPSRSRHGDVRGLDAIGRTRPATRARLRR